MALNFDVDYNDCAKISTQAKPITNVLLTVRSSSIFLAQRLLSFFHYKLRELVYNIHVAVNPMGRRPGNIHGFVLHGQSYRQE